MQSDDKAEFMSRPFRFALLVALCCALLVVWFHFGIAEFLTLETRTKEGPHGNCVVQIQVGRFGAARGKSHGTTRLELRGSEPYVLIMRKSVPVSASQGDAILSKQSRQLASYLTSPSIGLTIRDRELEKCLGMFAAIYNFTFSFDPSLPPEIATRRLTYPLPNSPPPETANTAVVLSEILGPDLTFSISTTESSITIHPVEK